jgi:hypothetical protein
VRRRPPEPWIDDEPRFASALKLVTSRALSRILLILGVSVALTGVLLFFRLQRVPVYEATDYFRMVEGEVGDATPPPPREIREYIAAVALSQKKLLEIMNTHHLYQRILAHDPVSAVQSMRDDIGIVVTRNYFVYERQPDDEPRSASISLSYSFSSGDVARDVVHELAQAVLDSQSAQRNARIRSERVVIRQVLDHEKTVMRGVQTELNLLYREASKAQGAALVQNQAQLSGSQERMKMGLERVHKLDRRAGDLELATAVEDNRLGISFQLVDETIEVINAKLSASQTVRVAVVLFACVGGVALGVVGAWGRRVYRIQDLVAARIPVFGRLSAFAGDDVGSYLGRTGKIAQKTRILAGKRHG